MPVFRLLQANGRLPSFEAAMVFAGLANGLAFFVLSRMRSLGLILNLPSSSPQALAPSRGGTPGRA